MEVVLFLGFFDQLLILLVCQSLFAQLGCYRRGQLAVGLDKDRVQWTTAQLWIRQV